ncbi:putative disease resistance protein [Dirofilaria immitis]
MLLCLCALVHSQLIQLAQSTVKCFCDKQNCEDSLICTGELCLIGFRSEDSQGHMEQLCSNMGDTKDLVKCQHNWNGWQEVCACEEDFCNTFAYLRGSIEEESTDNAADSQPPNLNEEESSIASLGRRRGSSLLCALFSSIITARCVDTCFQSRQIYYAVF